MKKEKLLIISTILIVFLVLIYKPILIKADSGFDSSWDSSSSSGSSSNWNSSSTRTGKDVTGIEAIIITIETFFAAALICLIQYLIIKKIQSINNKRISSYKLEKNEIEKILPNLNIIEFNNIVFNNYKKIQIAWMNFKLDDIRDIISDELYNMYSMQLETLKIKGQTNIMKDIEYIDNYISDIKIENDITTITTILQVTCYDYLINNNNKVIKGNKNAKLNYTYCLTFTKNSNNNLKICPNCGSSIQINSSGKCESCNSTIVNNENNWIMTKKQMLDQKKV